LHFGHFTAFSQYGRLFYSLIIYCPAERFGSNLLFFGVLLLDHHNFFAKKSVFNDKAQFFAGKGLTFYCALDSLLKVEIALSQGVARAVSHVGFTAINSMRFMGSAVSRRG